MVVSYFATGPSPASATLGGVTNHHCAYCGHPGCLKCSRCKKVRYCSQECQRQDWDRGHQSVCRNSLPLPEDSDHGVAVDKPKKKTRPLCPDLVASALGPPISTEGELTLPKKILFPYDKFRRYLEWDDVREPPTGLTNNGNSCYANSVLQCLAYTRPLAAYLLEGSHSGTCSKKPCFLCELERHMGRAFWKDPSRRAPGKYGAPPFSAKGVLRAVQQSQRWLGLDRQEDAHEFLRFALDSLQASFLEPFGGEAKVDPATQETTLVHHIFGGVLRSQVQCTVCSHESARYESMLDVPVEVEGDISSLDEALAQFTAMEWMDGENKYKCDRCRDYVRAGKRLVVHEAPNVLTVALKRFQAGRFGKLNKPVSFPLSLDLSPYMSQDPGKASRGDEPGPEYSLYAVVVHFDLLNSSFFGHYVCYVKGSGGRWYLVDDSEVTEVEESTVLEQKVYLLMYSRNTPKPAPTPVAPPVPAEVAAAPTAEATSANGELPAVNGVASPRPEVPTASWRPDTGAEEGAVPGGDGGRQGAEAEAPATANGIAPPGTLDEKEGQPSALYYGPDPGPFQKKAPALPDLPEGSVPPVANGAAPAGNLKRARSPVGRQGATSTDGTVPDVPLEEEIGSAVKLTTANLSSSDEEGRTDKNMRGLLKKDPKKREEGAKVGRNKMCTCGSNKKWKKCCGKKA